MRIIFFLMYLQNIYFYFCVIFQVDAVFQRPIVTCKTNSALNIIEEYQGKGNIYFAGSYNVYTVPLLESGLLSAMRVSESMGVKNPWKPIPTTMEQKTNLGCWPRFILETATKIVTVTAFSYGVYKVFLQK